MGKAGIAIGILFFVTVTFAAITSSVSVMEAIVSGLMDKWKDFHNKKCSPVMIYIIVMRYHRMPWLQRILLNRYRTDL